MSILGARSMTKSAIYYYNNSKYTSNPYLIMDGYYFDRFNNYYKSKKILDDFFNHISKATDKKMTLKDMKKFIKELDLYDKQLTIKERLSNMEKDFK